MSLYFNDFTFNAKYKKKLFYYLINILYNKLYNRVSNSGLLFNLFTFVNINITIRKN